MVLQNPLKSISDMINNDAIYATKLKRDHFAKIEN